MNRRTPLKVVFGYAAFGFVWILVSDRLVSLIFPVAVQTMVQTYKGWIFIAVTSCLLYFLVRSSIAEVLRVERLAEAERRRLVTAIEQGVDLVLIMDVAGRIRYVNPAVTNATGYAREEMLDRQLSEICEPEDAETLLPQGRETIWRGKTMMRKRDGGGLPLEGTLVPVRDEERLIVNYIAVMRDVSREMQMERMMRQTQKMEAIGALAGGIAHDFNNILQPIMGYTQMSMEMLPEDSKVRVHLHEVLNAGERARDLIKRILMFSRQQEHESRPLRLQSVVKEVLKLLRASIPTTIEFEQNIDMGCGDVLADPVQVHQIMMNLCTNAYQAMGDEGGVLKVTLDEVDLGEDELPPGAGSGGYVHLCVADTGKGMDRQVIEHIFEPYFTTKAPGEGTGMGLSVVDGIVRTLGGVVRAESVRGEGSVFHVYLPRIAVSGETFAEGARGPAPRGVERVLLVDDEPAVARLEQIMLERLGYEICAVTDSVEALEIFRREPQRFDLVLTDMTMPHLTGRDLARAVHEIRPDIPIIVCTGYSESYSGEDVKGWGIQGYIMKPMLRGDLAREIRRVIAASRENNDDVKA